MKLLFKMLCCVLWGFCDVSTPAVSPSVDQLPLGVADQPVVEPPVVFGVNSPLSPHLLVQAAYDRWQRWEAGGASQRVAVLPLILVQDHQVVLLDDLLHLFLELSPDLLFHLSS